MQAEKHRSRIREGFDIFFGVACVTKRPLSFDTYFGDVTQAKKPAPRQRQAGI
jgi:hypothetical protein